MITFQSVKKIWQKNLRADLSILSDTLRCWASISILTRDLLGI